MFGYVITNQNDLSEELFQEYRSYYCGLCLALKKHGNLSRLSLNYDLNFLVILLSALYEEEGTEEESSCILHPFHTQKKTTNRFSDYCADMTIALSVLKCADDWNDEKKYLKKTYGTLLGNAMEEVRKKYPEKISFIEQQMRQNNQLELQNETNLDVMANCTGQMMGEIFAYKKDEWEPTLRKMGYYLGKFIYYMDAYEDLEEDEKKHSFNVLLPVYQKNPEAFETFIEVVLEDTMANCAEAFEHFPIFQHRDILRNIVYSGVWTRYEMVKKKRREAHESI